MGDMEVKYLLTEKMLSDHFNKPLQGTALRKFRAEIQGILEESPDKDLGWDIPKNKFITIPHECVERSDVNTDKRTNKSW